MPLRATLAIAAALAANPWAEAGTSGAAAGCAESARTATRHPATWYDTFAGTSELMNVYEGDRVVFYSPEDLEAEQYSCILAHLDSCMAMYSAFAGGGAYPHLWSPEGFAGKGSVALVENTCGAGCGTSGRAEVLKEYADRSVSRVGSDISDPRGWQVSYYEMGRGTFPFYPALQLVDHVGQDGFPQWVHEIGSGFPHFMAHACMHRRGVSYEDQEAHFRRWEHHFPRENPPPHVFNGAYRALGLSFTEIVMRDNPELTLNPSSPPPPGGRRGVNHVFSMILTDLYREYGAPYVEVYLEDLAKMDAADSAEVVEQNMLDAALSAHYATNRGAGAVRRLQSVWRMNPDWRPRPWRTSGRPFSDHPIVPHVTPVQALHFAELRERIDEVRSAAGLTAFSWTDPVLRAGVTPVRLVHLLELREALGAAYAAVGRPAPVSTDPVAVWGTIAIRAAHLMELRAAVLALE